MPGQEPLVAPEVLYHLMGQGVEKHRESMEVGIALEKRPA